MVDLSDIKTLRNALSHMSISSKNGFESLVRSRNGHYPINMNPAGFLNLIDPRHNANPITFFGHYVSKLKFLSNLVVNPD
jgi:hypothetical protein